MSERTVRRGVWSWNVRRGVVCSVGIVEWGCVGVGVKGEKGENGEDGEGTGAVVEGEGRMWVVEEAG